MEVKEHYAEDEEQMAREQQQYYEELHQQTYDVLTKVKDNLTEEELSLLCYHCGFSINDFIKE